jgi:hypothetical protein
VLANDVTFRVWEWICSLRMVLPSDDDPMIRGNKWTSQIRRDGRQAQMTAMLTSRVDHRIRSRYLQVIFSVLLRNPMRMTRRMILITVTLASRKLLGCNGQVE